MRPMTLQEICDATHGTLCHAHNAESKISVVSTDTRSIPLGSLFIAIRGDRFDAHDFVASAAKSGATAAMIHKIPTDAATDFPLIVVSDTRFALGELAAFVRKQLRSKVIAVAGSNGKTSTKYLVGSVLGSKLAGSMSPKSFNNDIGVPLTILPADPNANYLVLELGTNHPGEIRRLGEIATPDIAVITNCGAEHLEFLKDLDGVRAENSALASYVRDGGVMIVNGDDAALLKLVARPNHSLITFGFDESNQFRATDISCDADGTRFSASGFSKPIFVNALGRHAALNALAAIAVARQFDLTESEIANALATAQSPDMRLQLTDVGGVRLLNDAYNANPNSMRAALETLASLTATGRKIAVLGDMRELGKTSEHFHREVGEFAATCSLDLLVCVGVDANFIASAAIEAGFDRDRIVEYANAIECAVAIAGSLTAGDLVLLKASRGIGLEAVARAIDEARSRRDVSHGA